MQDKLSPHAGGLSLCSIFQKSFLFLLPLISKQNQLDSPRMGELWCGTCAPSAGLHKPLTQPSRWTVAYFPGLSVLCGWNQYFVKWRWVNASSCAGLASVHKWQARFFIFPWTVIVSSPLHLQTCGCASTSEWVYLLYIWIIWKLQALEQGTFISRHCTQPCREAHGEHPWSSAMKWLNKNFVPNHQRYFEHICSIFIKKTTKPLERKIIYVLGDTKLHQNL